jgi:hypothetical protein
MTNLSDATELTEITLKRHLCRHIHTSGRRCGSPALRGEQFCYYHHTTRRPAPAPQPPLVPFISPDMPFVLPSFEDHASIQLGLAEILRRIAANQIDLPRAKLLLYGYQIAISNLRHHQTALYRERQAQQARDAQEEHEDSIDSQENDPLLVLAIDMDPDHGPLAPISPVPELGTKARPVGLGILQQLAEEVRGHRPFCPLCNPTGIQEESDPPATIPRLDASAEDTAPAPGGPILSSLIGKDGGPRQLRGWGGNGGLSGAARPPSPNPPRKTVCPIHRIAMSGT